MINIIPGSSLHSFAVNLRPKVIIGSILEQRARIPNKLLNVLEVDQPVDHYCHT